MPNYILIFRGGHADWVHASPDELQRLMQSWMDWIQGGLAAHWLVDGGDGLRPGAIVAADSSVIDGPSPTSHEFISGYSIVAAADLEAAVELAESSPQPAAGGTVEVRQLGSCRFGALRHGHAGKKCLVRSISPDSNSRRGSPRCERWQSDAGRNREDAIRFLAVRVVSINGNQGRSGQSRLWGSRWRSQR